MNKQQGHVTDDLTPLHISARKHNYRQFKVELLGDGKKIGLQILLVNLFLYV